MAAIAMREDISVRNVDGSGRHGVGRYGAWWRPRTVASMERSVNYEHEDERGWQRIDQWARIVASTSTKSHGARLRHANASVALGITTEINKRAALEGIEIKSEPNNSATWPRTPTSERMESRMVILFYTKNNMNLTVCPMD